MSKDREVPSSGGSDVQEGRWTAKMHGRMSATMSMVERGSAGEGTACHLSRQSGEGGASPVDSQTKAQPKGSEKKDGAVRGPARSSEGERKDRGEGDSRREQRGSQEPWIWF